MADPPAGLADQPNNAALGEPILSAKFSSRCPGQVLSNHALDRLRTKPLADRPLSAMVDAAGRDSRWSIGYVGQQGRVQFQSPQADHCSLLSEDISIVALARVTLSQLVL
jgi:hypothetical protein